MAEEIVDAVLQPEEIGKERVKMKWRIRIVSGKNITEFRNLSPATATLTYLYVVAVFGTNGVYVSKMRER